MVYICLLSGATSNLLHNNCFHNRRADNARGHGYFSADQYKFAKSSPNADYQCHEPITTPL